MFVLNGVVKQKCVSDHMGPQNRVGKFYFCLQYFLIVPRVRFLFKNKKIVHFQPHNFSQSGPIYFIFLYDPQ